MDTQTVVLPGDDVIDLIKRCLTRPGDRYVIGPGLKRVGDSIKVVKPGIIKSRDKPTLFWVDCRQKRYMPVRGERVVGTVIAKGSLTARIDIGANDLATLNLLAFEGATKKNRPDINVGDVVFARILTAHKDIETELVCISSKNKKDGMGILTPTQANAFSFVINVPLQVVRRLLTPGCELLPSLGKKFRFEIAVGMNGRIWICSNSALNTMFICNSISEVEHLDENGVERMNQAVLSQFELVGRG
ncbi:Exosome complex component RRP40 [Halotydeus destructor]|nr:Exosome complex component RRP40 [Halotydeus destructor]